MRTNFTVGQQPLQGASHAVSFEQMVEFESVVWHRDPNVHSSPELASEEGLRSPIASGQHQLAFMHEMLEKEVGEQWVRGGKIKTRYIHPVRAGDVITTHGEISAVTPNATTGRSDVEIKIWCTNQDGQQTAVATAMISAAAEPSQANPVKGGPLSGIRVLEFTHAWAGPYCGMMLADMGADVIKVERPGQDPEARGGYPYVAGESVPFLYLHRNKRSITLDLKSSSGKEALSKLIGTADVLLQNFRPGVMQDLGFGYDDVHALNDNLVYASISGFGNTGPLADAPGVDIIAQAMSGIAMTSRNFDTIPKPTIPALCDNVAAMWAAYGIVCALHEVKNGGKGQHVDASLYEAGLSLVFSPTAMYYHGLRSQEETDNAEANAPSAYLEAADGVYVAVFASYPALWNRLVEALDLQELAADPRYATRADRTTNSASLHADLRDIFRTQSSDHWISKLEEAGVPVGRVSDMSRALDHPQIAAREMLVTSDHPTAGLMPLPGVPIKLSSTPGRLRREAPLLGGDTADVLAEIADPGELEQLLAEHDLRRDLV